MAQRDVCLYAVDGVITIDRLKILQSTYRCNGLERNMPPKAIRANGLAKCLESILWR